MELSSEFLKLGIALIGFVAWLVRLEFITKQNKHDVSMIWRKHDDLDKTVMEKLSKIESSLARIEGQLSVSVKDR